MAPMRIDLLGPPGITVDGTEAPGPRGAKSWALLAYLVLADRPVPRSRLADLLFDEADDPAGALRWTLSQVRRSVRGAASLSGDPVRWEPADGTLVDVDVVAAGSWTDALSLPSFGGSLLEGVTLRTGPVFELWLASERRRLSATTAALLQAAAHDRLARGDASEAVDIASRVVACEPLDESGHELLVRAMVSAGDREGAAAHVDRSTELFRRELGREPSPALADALRSPSGIRLPRNRSAVLAAIDLGLGAAQAGAYDRAVEVLRQAVGAAAGERDEISARAQAALGTVLVHGVRGSDEEAITLLHQAFQIGAEISVPQVAAQAAHELGVVETMRGHYQQMESWFARAFALAGDDARLLAWNGVYAGFGRTDLAQYSRAIATFRQAIELAGSVGERRAFAYANAGLGRLHLLREDLVQARKALDVACTTARDLGWTSFVPFPQALLGEVDLLEGNQGAAADAFEHAYALACQVGDPCWEGYALRGRGLLAAQRGDDRLALELLVEAPAASRRLRDAHAWVGGFCLETLCDFAIARGLPDAEGWVEELDDFAGRHGMRELAARAALHRVSLGHPGARRRAADLLGEIVNPALSARLGGNLSREGR